MQNCQDTFSATFTSYNELFGYQQQVSSRSQWSHCAVNQLHVEPLNHNSSCYPALKEFAPGGPRRQLGGRGGQLQQPRSRHPL